MKINTKQEAFDFAVRHMFTQREKSRAENSSMCMYRGRDGLMCIVGAMIDDEHYNMVYEESDASDERVQSALRASGVNLEALFNDQDIDKKYSFYTDDSAFLLGLQDCHDLWAEDKLSYLYARFKNFAILWGLDTKVLEELKLACTDPE